MLKPASTHRTSRLCAGALLLAFASVLGGCSTPAWDPTDLMDFLDTEKRTPGERKPVFPEGVPGISQGVPKEMIRGSAESRAGAEGQVAAEAQAVASAPPVEVQPPPPPPAKRSRTAAKRPPAQAPVEIAPDDVNVEVAPPPRRQSQRATQPQATQQPNPFPAPLPR
jgi:hypothetical protein